MSFTQKLFTSYHPYPDGNTRIGELNRIWYDSNTNTLRIQLDATPGGTIISGGGGLVLQAISVNTVAASNGGSLTYSNGLFTYAPANLSSFATTTYVDNQITSVKDRIVSPNNSYATVIDNTGTTTVAGNLVPNVTTNTLGTIANPWKDIYVSQGSIVIANVDPAVDGVSISNTDRYIVIDRGGLKVTANDGTHEVFQLDYTGKLILKSLQPALTSTAALSLVGNLLGNQLPTTNLGVMLQATGTQDQPSRIYVDGVGTYLTANAYPAFIGRAARGTADSPLPIQSGDLIARFGGNAYGTTIGLNSISNVRVDMVATETQSDTTRGSRVEIWTTPVGSAVPQRSLHIDSQGIDLSEATDTNAGVTFKNGSLLTYWPSVSGNANKILRTNGTDFFWSAETVPTGQVLFKGNWDASANTPTLSTSLPTGVSTGWQYIVSVAGTQNINGTGAVAYALGDQVIYNGSTWLRIPAPTAQVQTNWTETNSSLPAYIQNKPTLATVATTGSYTDLSNRPSIPTAQVNSDWNATSGLAQILNKPSIPTQYTDTLARAAITLTSNTPSGTVSTLTYTSGAFTFTSAAALVSGTTIKTVNSNSLLGSGDVAVGTVTSVSGTGSVSGLTLSGSVSVSGSLTLGGTLSGITNSNLSGTAGITNANLATPTISGVQLGNNLATLTISGPLTGTSYNGSSAVSIGIPQATGSASGYLSSTDWTTFNNKSNTTGTVTSIATAGTVSGLTLTGGTITTSGTITLGGSISGLTNSNLSGTAGITNANLANSTISGVALGGSLYNLTAGTGITFSSGTTYNGSTAITINSSTVGVDDFTSTVTTQASTLTVDFAGSSVIFWQPSATGNRTVTLSNFTAGRRVKIFITPKATLNTFTFTGVTASQCSNGSITFVLGGGGVAQSSMMIELFSTTTAIGGVWIFGYGSQ